MASPNCTKDAALRLVGGLEVKWVTRRGGLSTSPIDARIRLVVVNDHALSGGDVVRECILYSTCRVKDIELRKRFILVCLDTSAKKYVCRIAPSMGLPTSSSRRALRPGHLLTPPSTLILGLACPASSAP